MKISYADIPAGFDPKQVSEFAKSAGVFTTAAEKLNQVFQANSLPTKFASSDVSHITTAFSKLQDIHEVTQRQIQDRLARNTEKTNDFIKKSLDEIKKKYDKANEVVDPKEKGLLSQLLSKVLFNGVIKKVMRLLDGKVIARLVKKFPRITKFLRNIKARVLLIQRKLSRIPGFKKVFVLLKKLKSIGRALAKPFLKIVKMIRAMFKPFMKAGKLFLGFSKIFTGPILSVLRVGFRFVSKLLIPVTILLAIFDAFKGWKEATKQGKTDVFEKIWYSLSSVLSGVTGGLISTETIFKYTKFILVPLKIVGGVFKIISKILRKVGEKIADFFFDSISFFKSPDFSILETAKKALGIMFNTMFFGLPNLLFGNVIDKLDSAKDGFSRFGNKIGMFVNSVQISIKDFFGLDTQDLERTLNKRKLNFVLAGGDAEEVQDESFTEYLKNLGEGEVDLSAAKEEVLDLLAKSGNTKIDVAKIRREKPLDPNRAEAEHERVADENESTSEDLHKFTKKATTPGSVYSHDIHLEKANNKILDRFQKNKERDDDIRKRDDEFKKGFQKNLRMMLEYKIWEHHQKVFASLAIINNEINGGNLGGMEVASDTGANYGSGGGEGGSGGTGGGGGSGGDINMGSASGGSAPSGSGLGALSAKYESGGKDSNAVGYDSKGGTSYGTYQIASKTGTFGNFLKYLQKSGHGDVAKELAAAGPANTGSKGGAASDAWKRLVREGKLTHEMEHGFIKDSHYDPAVRGLKSQTLKDMIASSKTLQDVMWSTSVQHGAGGASSIFNAVYREGMTVEQLIDAVYQERTRRFRNNPYYKQAASRFQRERADAHAMLAREKQGGGAEASPAQTSLPSTSGQYAGDGRVNAPSATTVTAGGSGMGGDITRQATQSRNGGGNQNHGAAPIILDPSGMVVLNSLPAM